MCVFLSGRFFLAQSTNHFNLRFRYNAHRHLATECGRKMEESLEAAQVRGDVRLFPQGLMADLEPWRVDVIS
jgi:hypothetical protein